MSLFCGAAEYGISAYLGGGDLEDMVEEELFVSQPVHSQAAQKQEAAMKQEFSQLEQLQFCLPAPPTLQAAQPPPLKIVNSQTLKKSATKSGKKGKKPGGPSRALRAWQHPPFLKSRPGQKKLGARPESAGAIRAGWDGTTSASKTFDDMKKNVLQQRMLREQQAAAAARPQSSTALRIENSPNGGQRVLFAGRQKQRTLEFVQDARVLAAPHKTPQQLAQERKTLQEEAKRQKEINRVQAQLEALQAETGSPPPRGAKAGAKRDIFVAKPVTAGPVREDAEGAEAMGEVRAGVALTLEAKDRLIIELQEQYEGLLATREQMNADFQQRVLSLQDEKARLQALALARSANPLKREESKTKSKENRSDNVPTRDPGLRPLSNRKPMKSSRPQSPKKLVSTLESGRASAVGSSTRKGKAPPWPTAQEAAQAATEAARAQAEIDQAREARLAAAVAERVAGAVLGSAHPNTQLANLQQEVGQLGARLAPVVARVEATAQTLGAAGYVKRKSDAVGMVGRVAGQFMGFHADKLAELLLDQLLEDTAEELQSIEAQLAEAIETEQGLEAAHHLANLVSDFGTQADRLEGRLQAAQSSHEIIINSGMKARTTAKRGKGGALRVDLEGIEADHEGQVYRHPFSLATASETQDASLSGLRFEQGEALEFNSFRPGKRVVTLSKEHRESIDAGVQRWSEYVRRVDGSDNPEVWKLYDHLADEYFNEFFAEVVRDAQGDIEAGLEQIILDEILAAPKAA